MFDLQPRLAGSLIALRPTLPSDRDALFALASDPDVWALHPHSDRYKPDVFAAFFEGGLASGGALTAIDQATGAVAGWSRYSFENALPCEIEIGWTFLGRTYWGGAHNAEMKRLMLAHAFRFVDQVIFRVGVANLRSRRAVEKLGAILTDRPDPSNPERPELVHVTYAIPKDRFAG